MIALACVAIICAAALFAQRQAHQHQERVRAGRGQIHELGRRLAELEAAQKREFDPAAFEDLRNKVEALRMAQGLRGK